MTRMNVIVNNAILVTMICVCAVWVGTEFPKYEGRISRDYPVEAAQFLRDSGRAGERGFNMYRWGGYLIWQGFPVFIDGRADMFGGEYIRNQYFKVTDLRKDWHEPLDEHSIDYVIVSKGTKLGTLLTESLSWEQAYKDDTAEIFVRK